jgi:hypothetical protein
MQEFEKPLFNRSLRTTINHDSPEVFTAVDYTEARAFENVLDIVGEQQGLPVDAHTHPDDELLKESLAMLGLDIDRKLEEDIKELLISAKLFCWYMSHPGYSSMSQLERDSYDPKYQRTEDQQLKPFFQQMKYFMSRFITEDVERAKHNGDSETTRNQYQTAIYRCSSLVEELRSHTHNLFVKDFKAYDTTFDSFDDSQRRDPSQVEIYLGRDGIHAYHGRLGELAARGDVAVEIQELDLPSTPTRTLYLVYSRNLTKFHEEAKRLYLAQQIPEGINPQFFDTGYNGSIPIDIIATLGMDTRNASDHINMLNSFIQERRVKGLEANIQIDDIECSPKMEDTSVKLAVGEDGIFRYEARVNPLREQFIAQVIRSITMRHFWAKERTELLNGIEEN